MLRHFNFRLILLISCTTLCFVNAAPQQTNPNVEGIIRDIFSTSPGTPRPTRPGFNTIVTPVPIDRSQPEIAFTSISGKGQCNCVAYHLCDPSTNSMTTNNTVTEEEEDEYYPKIDIRFNADDPVCEHFLDVCCGTNNTREQSITPRPTPPKGCGIRNPGGIDLNILDANDNEAGFGEFPWTVALLHANNNSYFCSGSLIHPQVVLTAAHCVINRPTNSFRVRAGEWDTQTTKERLPFEERNVQRIITHPQYNPRNVANDLGLLILANGLTLGEHINVVCLPAQDATTMPGTTCFSTGWGKDAFGAEGRYFAVMKRVPLPIVEFNRCQTQLRGTRLGEKFKLHRSFLCAGGQQDIDTCEGDGGAPLACPIGNPAENRYQQSGIVAWGIGCNAPIPAAYANVALARNWIDEQVLANGFPTASYSVF